MTDATLSDLKKIVKKYGATYEDNKIGNSHSCEVFAPNGFKWAGSGIHVMVDVSYRPWKPDYDDLIARMEYGLEKCDDPECEWCHPELYDGE